MLQYSLWLCFVPNQPENDLNKYISDPETRIELQLMTDNIKKNCKEIIMISLKNAFNTTLIM